MEANAERHRLIAGVLHGQGQARLAACQGVAHGQSKIKRVDELGQAVGGQGQLDGILGGGLDLPGQQVGQAVDLDGMIGTAEVMHAAIRLAAVGEQDGHAAAGTVGGFKVLVTQPEILLAGLGERRCHAALFRCDGQGIVAVRQGQGLVADAILLVDALGQFSHITTFYSALARHARFRVKCRFPSRFWVFILKVSSVPSFQRRNITPVIKARRRP